MKRKNKKIIDFINEQCDVENSFHKIENKIDYSSYMISNKKSKQNSSLLYRLGIFVMASSVAILIFNHFINLKFEGLGINTIAGASTPNTSDTDALISQGTVIETREFQYQEINYFTLLNEDNKVNESLVGEFINTTEHGDIFYYKSHKTLLRIALLIDDTYYNAVFNDFVDKDSITIKYLIEDLYNITSLDIEKILLTNSMHEIIYQETNSQWLSDIYDNLLESTYDTAGFMQLMYDIYLLSTQDETDLILSNNSLSPSGYQGSIKDTYSLTLKSEKIDIVFYYYTTKLIHSPKYIQIHGIYYKLNDNISQWLSTHIMD